MDIHMYGLTDKYPLHSTGHRPFGAAAQKGKKKGIKEERDILEDKDSKGTLGQRQQKRNLLPTNEWMDREVRTYLKRNRNSEEESSFDKSVKGSQG